MEVMFAPKEHSNVMEVVNGLKHRDRAFKYWGKPNLIGLGCTAHHVMVIFLPRYSVTFHKFHYIFKKS